MFALFPELIQVGNVFSNAFLEQRDTLRFPDSPDIHSPPGNEVLYSLLYLGGTGGIGTVGHNLAFGPDDGPPALGTEGMPLLIFLKLVKKAELLTPFGTFPAFGSRPDHLRYHLTGALD